METEYLYRGYLTESLNKGLIIEYNYIEDEEYGGYEVIITSSRT